MKYVIAVVAVLAMIYLARALASRRSRLEESEPLVRVAGAPQILERLTATRNDGNFAVFMFEPPGGTGKGDVINLQLSIEGGRPGVDWVLIADRNVRDQDKFRRYAEGLGFRVSSNEMNAVEYLRVEDGDLAALCVGIMQEVYGLDPMTQVVLLTEGFEWHAPE